MKPVPKTNSDRPSKISESVDKCVDRISAKKEAPYFRQFLTELITNNAIPLELLEHIPVPVSEIGKTRFDQIYDAAIALVFPGYKRETLEKLLGPLDGKGGKIWRVLLPERFRIAHVLIRAKTFQEAFALGCDYACRASLRMFGTIPVDLTIRVVFMSERSLRRILDIRWANKNKKRLQLKLVGREFTAKQLNGARLLAMGHPKDPKYSIIKYVEKKDLDVIFSSRGLIRKSSIEQESHKYSKKYKD